MLALARRYAHAGPALWVLAATTIANVFAYLYQVVMARLLTPGDYAILTALFGILILEQLSAQVIQSATARIAAQYRARGEEAALHVFVRRWTRRILIGAGLPSIAIAAAAPLIGAAASRALLPSTDAGAYAASITMAKIVLFAPIAVGFLLLERTARAHARGEDTDRALFAALGFVVATSGLVTAAYLIAPAPLVRLIVGDQYPIAATLIGPYAIAALLNALLSLWIA